MPSLIHETPIELIRQCPELVLDVLRELSEREGLDLRVADPGSVTVRLAPTDMSAVVPTQFLADIVVVADDAHDVAVLCVVVEPQGRDPETKQYSWPVYLTVARAVNRCPTVLVVICLDPGEAQACRQTIRTGHPGFDLTAIVVDASNSGPGEALPRPYLILFAGCMGAIDLDTDAGQDAVLEAARQVPGDKRKSCITLILAAASEAAQHAMEAKMAGTAYRNEFIESFYEAGQAEGKAAGRAAGRAEGRAEGLAEGFAEGEAVGKAEALRDTLLSSLNIRGFILTKEHRRDIEACTDEATLRRRFDRSLTARTIGEVFEE
jgi:hypothetical protein